MKTTKFETWTLELKKQISLKTMICIFLLCGSALPLAAQSLGSAASAKLIGDTLNFEVLGIKNWNYSLSRKERDGKTVVTLKVDQLQAEKLTTLDLVANPFVSDIKVVSAGADQKPHVEFTLRSRDVETFDYLTEDPPRLIIDFYKQIKKVERRGPVKNSADMSAEGESVSLTASPSPGDSRASLEQISKAIETEKQKDAKTAVAGALELPTKDTSKVDKSSVASSKLPANVSKPSTTKPGTQKRQIAQERFNINNVDYNPLKTQNASISLKSGLFDGGDPTFSRFKVKDFEIDQQQIIKGLNNYYLPFPMLDQTFYFWSEMKSNPPKYEIQRSDSVEYKSFKLVKNLYEKNRSLVLRKTLYWYADKFPNSPYLEMGYLMAADRMLDLSVSTGDSNHFKTAIDLYEDYLSRWPQSVLAERTSLMIGFLQLEQKDYFQAIRKFEIHIKNATFDKRKSKDYALLGQAYALSRLGQLSDALVTLDRVKNEANDRRIEAEATFSKADFLMREYKYDEAVKAYEFALGKFSDFRTKYPNAVFNQMEALFRTQNPIESHKSALEFVQNFPSHEFAPFALTRLGELLEILVKDPKKSVGAFLETHFRYGDDPKTVIARLHLLSARMKGMKDLELNETLRKMDELTKKSTIENLDQFKVIMVGDGFARRGDFEKAIDILEKFYQQSPNRKNSDQVTNRINRYAHDMVRDFSNSENHRAVLENIRKFRYTWLKNRDRIDTEFAVGLAYQSVGVYDQALSQVTDVKARLEKLGNSRADLTVRAMQVLPTMEKVLLTQAQIDFELGKFKESYDALDRASNVENLTPKDQIDRVYLMSQIYERQGDTESAIRFLTDVLRQWKEEKRHITKSQLRLAKLESDRKNFARALEVIKEAQTEGAAEEDQILILKTRSDIALKASNSAVAIESLQKLMDDFPSRKEFSEQRYTLGRLYFESGDIKKAEKTWKQFPETSVWEKLAQDKMADTQWLNEHKKYIQRLPAATETAVNGVNK